MELEIFESSPYEHVDEVTPKNLLNIKRMVQEKKKAKDQALDN